eukprot:Rmarinus@m.21832
MNFACLQITAFLVTPRHAARSYTTNGMHYWINFRIFLRSHSSAKKERASYFTLIGQIYDCDDQPSSQARSWLQRAVKLDPTSVDAWTLLGHCCMKEKDFRGARNSLDKALSKQRSVEALRFLSLLLRMEKDVTREALQESADVAKEAVRLDVTDGESWYVLGNAYHALYHLVSRDTKDLDAASKAYSQAISAPKSFAPHPDLFFNYATLLRYREMYTESISYYNKVHALDRSLAGNQKALDIVHFVRKMSRLVHTRGGLKPKRFSAVVGALSGTQDASVSCGGTVFSFKTSVESLVAGVNRGAAFRGVIVASLPADEAAVSLQTVVSDSNGCCVCVSVYNLGVRHHALFTVGDVVEVLEPVLRRIEVYEDRVSSNARSTARSGPGSSPVGDKATGGTDAPKGSEEASRGGEERGSDNCSGTQGKKKGKVSRGGSKRKDSQSAEKSSDAAGGGDSGAAAPSEAESHPLTETRPCGDPYWSIRVDDPRLLRRNGKHVSADLLASSTLTIQT